MYNTIIIVVSPRKIIINVSNLDYESGGKGLRKKKITHAHYTIQYTNTDDTANGGLVCVKKKRKKNE